MRIHEGWPLSAFRVLILVSIFFLSFPQPVLAKPNQAVTFKFDISSVKMDETVTIRTVNIPTRTNFTVYMGRATNKAADGVVSTEFNSGAGGVLEFSFPIPSDIKGTRIIGIRVESKDGYQGYNWFFNRDQYGLLPDPNLKPDISFSDVKKNATVAVQAVNLPPNTQFKVRVGPHQAFYQKYISTDSVTTDANGSIMFSIPLTENTKDSEYISVRMDGGSKYLFGTFQNREGGQEASPYELVKVVPCTLLTINPIHALAPREDFDVIWTMQNTGLEDWNHRRFLFKFRDGEAMHKYDDKVFLAYTVERGWTHELVIDMLAPEKPGWHTTTWALVNRFDETICNFKVNVFVQE